MSIMDLEALTSHLLLNLCIYLVFSTLYSHARKRTVQMVFKREMLKINSSPPRLGPRFQEEIKNHTHRHVTNILAIRTMRLLK